jgi:tetratricopeptide (TPR) repeat protein
VGCVGVTLAVAAFSNWPTPFEKNLGAATRNSIASHLLRSGRVEEAEAYFRQALGINPKMAPAHSNLAGILRTSGRVEEAIEHYRATIEIQRAKGNAADASVHYELGLAYLETRQVGRAREQLAIAMGKHPAWHGPVNASAWLLATDPDPSVREPQEAIRLAEQAARLTQGQNASVLDTLAAAYASAGRFEQAEETARRALEKADASRHAEFAEAIRMRLELYQRSEPYVQSETGR